jgi:excisionase family DNA binding protein
MEKNEKLFVTSKELSQLISIPVFSIQKMVREKILPAYSLNNGRRFLFNLNEVMTIISDSKIN